jgi:hypothetical protein
MNAAMPMDKIAPATPMVGAHAKAVGAEEVRNLTLHWRVSEAVPVPELRWCTLAISMAHAHSHVLLSVLLVHR